MANVLDEVVKIRGFEDQVAKDAGNAKSRALFTKQDETFTEGGANDIIIAGSAVDVPLNFGGVTNAKRVVLMPLNGVLTAKIIGGATPNAVPVAGIMVLSGNNTQTITAISVSNPGVDPVDLRFAIYG